MKKAISILGPPASGKSTIIHPYRDRCISVGEYTHSLDDEDPLKKRCLEHWQDNRVFNPGLVADILKNYVIEDKPWYLLDGTPRIGSSVSLVEESFDLKALIEIKVDRNVWLKRISHLSNNGRSNRKDSLLPQLFSRMEFYEEEMKNIRPHFENIYIIENSGSIGRSSQRFEEIIMEVFPE